MGTMHENGGTTGNELHDALIRHYGSEAFDENRLRFYEELNEAMTGRANQPFAVVFSHTQTESTEGCFGGPITVGGFNYVVYGVLTGEPLTHTEEMGLVIPCVSSIRFHKTAERGVTAPGSHYGGQVYFEHLSELLDRGDSQLVPAAIYELTRDSRLAPRFQIAVGAEAVNKSLSSLEHLRLPWCTEETAVSIAQMYLELGTDTPIPDIIRLTLELKAKDLVHSLEIARSRYQESMDRKANLRRSHIAELHEASELVTAAYERMESTTGCLDVLSRAVSMLSAEEDVVVTE